MAQAAADKLGGVMAQVEVESTLDKEADPEAPQDDQVPESTAAALALLSPEARRCSRASSVAPKTGRCQQVAP